MVQKVLDAQVTSSGTFGAHSGGADFLGGKEAPSRAIGTFSFVSLSSFCYVESLFWSSRGSLWFCVFSRG
jgi:hypothetical protein